jgi:predicted MPP superfamily phosphohydrolase/predicted hydrocarbon binding protein
MADTMNILHLSDLHFGYENKESNEDVVPYKVAHRKLTLDDMKKALIGNIKKGTLLFPDVIVITGDIAWSAKKEEYSAAKKWINELLEGLNLLSAEVSGKKLESSDIVICPGNHDFDRQKGISLRIIASIEDSVTFLSKPHQSFISPFKNYSDFCKDLGIKPYIFEGNEVGHYLFGKTNVGGVTFVVLNSAWNVRGDNDKGKLWLGQPQLLRMIHDLPDLEDNTDIIVTLFHHPSAWLDDNDHYFYYENAYKPAFAYVTQFSHIILNGHTHGVVNAPDRISKRSMVFTGGATYGSSGFWNSFETLQVIVNHKKVIQRVVTFNPSKAKWETDTPQSYFIPNQHQLKGEASGDVMESFLGYYPARGVLINPEDGARNVAFRVDTFGNIFNEMSLQLRRHNVQDVENLAYECGRSCGEQFGERICKLWDEEPTPPDFEQKITRWCEFDSSVGFGKFIHNLTCDDQTKKVSGTLTINECIQPSSTDVTIGKTCDFIKGYCAGCIQTITKTECNISLECDQMCKPSSCVFTVISSDTTVTQTKDEVGGQT